MENEPSAYDHLQGFPGNDFPEINTGAYLHVSIVHMYKHQMLYCMYMYVYSEPK